MHSASDNVKLIPYSDANKVADELFNWLCWKY